MAITSFIELYNKYYKNRNDERLGLFELISQHFKIQRALYAGSFVHITPSFVITDVVYVDSDRQAKKAFAEMPLIVNFVEDKKRYAAVPQITFHGVSYTTNFGEAEQKFDLLISQYAGFVSQACKRYLKVGGKLLVNNSHGDASMANLDEDYKLIGVVNHRNSRYRLVSENLEAYFVPKKKDLQVTKEYLKKHQRGIGYTKAGSVYIFERIK